MIRAGSNFCSFGVSMTKDYRWDVVVDPEAAGVLGAYQVKK
jgi:hypothetical protein